MPNFKEFMKGFEEPETEPKAEPKPQEVKTEKPKVEESEFSKSRPAFTHDFAESLRKDAINWANEKLPHDKSLPKILNNYTRDEVIDFMRGNIGEDEIMKRAKERNGINQDRVNLLAKQETPKPQPKPGSFGKMIEGFEEKEKTNEEKARELANAPETEQSFNRIYADLNKGFEETYKRKPTQDELDAIRDIARLQTALVVMATKK